MKPISIFPNAVLASLLVIGILFFALPATRAGAGQPSRPVSPVSQTGCDSNRSIQVSGTAVVNVSPDRALIQLGVQSNGRTAAAVQAANSVAIEQVVKAVKALGVEAGDISTDWYVIEPLYEEYDSLRIKGYRINNTVAITLREVSKINVVITAVMQAGANQVVNVELYTSELRKYRDQARALAMEAAVEKASALAEAAGASTGCVLNISENSWSYYNGWWYGRYGSGSNQSLWTQNVSQNAAPAAGETGALSEAGPVSLGQISVKAEVSASFGLQ